MANERRSYRTFHQEQFESLAEAVRHGSPELPTGEQLVRLLQNCAKGIDWRNGGWK